MAGNNYLPTEYQTFIHASRYARWLPDEGRRETWIETVTRLTNFFQIHLVMSLSMLHPIKMYIGQNFQLKICMKRSLKIEYLKVFGFKWN